MFVFQDFSSLTQHFSTGAEMSSAGAESQFLSVCLKTTETGLRSMDSEAGVGEASTVESLIAADTPASEDKSAANETFHVSDPHTKDATRLIPARPITPFAVTTSAEEQRLSTALHSVPVSETPDAFKRV